MASIQSHYHARTCHAPFTDERRRFTTSLQVGREASEEATRRAVGRREWVSGATGGAGGGGGLLLIDVRVLD